MSDIADFQHEKITIPTLLNNAESWTMNKTEVDELERVELQALKNLFKLPIQTPNTAVIFTFGTLYTKQRIDQMQLIFLHKVLNRPPGHWTLKMLLTLQELNIGWGKSIKETLSQYNLPNEFQEIKLIPRPEWKRRVKTAIETKNLERLIDSCHKKEEETQIVKTKTASIVATITSSSYSRKPQYDILKTSKRETRTIILARYGLLECGKNYKGTMKETCDSCNCIDDEDHRLNYCIKWRNLNLYESSEKIDFKLLYSNSLVDIRHVISKIDKVWNTHTANGTMHTD